MTDNSFFNLIKFNTCLNSKPGSCIDFILTNKPKGFQYTGVMETGVSDTTHLQYSTTSNLKQIHFYKMLNSYPKD